MKVEHDNDVCVCIQVRANKNRFQNMFACHSGIIWKVSANQLQKRKKNRLPNDKYKKIANLTCFQQLYGVKVCN
jgi:hypothetical protein